MTSVPENLIIPSEIKQEHALTNTEIVTRLTGLWAFSEAGLGGLLHAFKIPFTGLFIASFAVIIIAFITELSPDKKAVLRSTFLVIAVKIIASPQSPFTAHFAVLLQGFAGFFIYRYGGFSYLSTISHGIFALVYSAIQKIITLTIIFGIGFWQSLNIFADSALKEFNFIPGLPQNFSWIGLLISLYITLYMSVGILAGYYAKKIPDKVNSLKSYILANYKENTIQNAVSTSPKKRSFRLNATFMLLAFAALLTYILPLIIQGNIYEGLFIIIRAAIVVAIWVYVASPLFKRALRSKIFRRVKSEEIEEIISSFPDLRRKAAFAWNYSGKSEGFARIKMFLSALLITVVFNE